MKSNLKIGDKVKWNTPQGETNGEIIAIKGTGENKRYEVKSDKTGKKAIHKAEALNKL